METAMCREAVIGQRLAALSKQEGAQWGEEGGQRDGQTPITLWPTRRACGACQQVEARALVSAAKSADEGV